MRKQLDLKEIEVLSMKEQIKRYQIKLKDLNGKAPIAIDNGSNFNTRSKGFESPYKNAKDKDNFPFPSPKNLKFNNYEDLF